MPGRAPKPPEVRRNRRPPIRGEWKPSSDRGWQHGPVPDPPTGLMPESVKAWSTWMHAWFATHWTEDDLPGLRTLIRTYDQVERNEFQRGPELRILMDTYGVTPKGQQDRRWAAPKPTDTPISEVVSDADDPYAHLRVVV